MGVCFDFDSNCVPLVEWVTTDDVILVDYFNENGLSGDLGEVLSLDIVKESLCLFEERYLRDDFSKTIFWRIVRRGFVPRDFFMKELSRMNFMTLNKVFNELVEYSLKEGG